MGLKIWRKWSFSMAKLLDVKGYGSFAQMMPGVMPAKPSETLYRYTWVLLPWILDGDGSVWMMNEHPNKTTEAAGSCFLEPGLVYAAEGKSIVTISAVRATCPDLSGCKDSAPSNADVVSKPTCTILWGDENALMHLAAIFIDFHCEQKGARVAFSIADLFHWVNARDLLRWRMHLAVATCECNLKAGIEPTENIVVVQTPRFPNHCPLWYSLMVKIFAQILIFDG